VHLKEKSFFLLFPFPCFHPPADIFKQSAFVHLSYTAFF